MSDRCGFVPPTPGYAPCTREKGHTGPCAHDFDDNGCISVGGLYTEFKNAVIEEVVKDVQDLGERPMPDMTRPLLVTPDELREILRKRLPLV